MSIKLVNAPEAGLALSLGLGDAVPYVSEGESTRDIYLNSLFLNVVFAHSDLEGGIVTPATKGDTVLLLHPFMTEEDHRELYTRLAPEHPIFEGLLGIYFYRSEGSERCALWFDYGDKVVIEESMISDKQVVRILIREFSNFVQDLPKLRSTCDRRRSLGFFQVLKTYDGSQVIRSTKGYDFDYNLEEMATEDTLEKFNLNRYLGELDFPPCSNDLDLGDLGDHLACLIESWYYEIRNSKGSLYIKNSPEFINRVVFSPEHQLLIDYTLEGGNKKTLKVYHEESTLAVLRMEDGVVLGSSEFSLELLKVLLPEAPELNSVLLKFYPSEVTTEYLRVLSGPAMNFYL